MRVKLLESNPDKYVKLDFELLRTELREFEALVTELHEALNGSSPTLDSLYVEVTKYQRYFRNTNFFSEIHNFEQNLRITNSWVPQK